MKQHQKMLVGIVVGTGAELAANVLVSGAPRLAPWLVMFICVLAGIGTAGVPAGSIPVIAMILGMFKLPPEGLALILGVDRFLDRCRTVLDVTGDLAASVYVARGEPEPPHSRPVASAS